MKASRCGRPCSASSTSEARRLARRFSTGFIATTKRRCARSFTTSAERRRRGRRPMMGNACSRGSSGAGRASDRRSLQSKRSDERDRVDPATHPAHVVWHGSRRIVSLWCRTVSRAESASVALPALLLRDLSQDRRRRRIRDQHGRRRFHLGGVGSRAREGVSRGARSKRQKDQEPPRTPFLRGVRQSPLGLPPRVAQTRAPGGLGD